MVDESSKEFHLARYSMERSSDPIFWVDEDAKFHHVNDAACRKLGFTRAELLCMTVHDINPDFSRDDWSKTWARIKAGESSLIETRHKTKDGRVIPVEVAVNYIEFNGKGYSCNIVRDLTERNEAIASTTRSQMYYRTLVENIDLGISLIDRDHNTMMSNSALGRLFGVNPDQLQGQMCFGKFISQDRQCANCPGDKAMSSGHMEEVEHKHEFEDGSHIHLRIRAFPLARDTGEASGFIEIIEDITERKRMDMALRNSMAEVETLKDRLQAENIYLREEIKVEHNFEEIIGRSETIKKVLKKIEQVAATTATVLILGESGTGKELLARAVHNLSDRKDRPLVKVNCASLPASLIESELFGHEKGAFTGALVKKIGRFELADRGTIFLDEVGDLPLDLQAKLLRVLQEGEFERLGNSRTTKVDVRIIAATNRDLEKALEKGEFREDLYYRLNVFPVTSPPLRSRRDDIHLLVQYFVMKYSAKIGKNIETIPKKLINSLEAYDWPGNVRELENVIERAIILSGGSVLELDEAFDVRVGSLGKAAKPATIKQMEIQMIRSTLEECNWVIEGKRGAAKRLDLAPSTLRERIKKYGLKKPSN